MDGSGTVNDSGEALHIPNQQSVQFAGQYSLILTDSLGQLQNCNMYMYKFYEAGMSWNALTCISELF